MKKRRFLDELPLAAISTVFEDDEGNIWIGTQGKGILNFPGFNFVHFNQSYGLPTDLVLDINEDNSGPKIYWNI